jgi:pyruvate/2-oxoglutarate dehydrogenase complex dihydrolipoamide dehydrogenase (E3) component
MLSKLLDNAVISAQLFSMLNCTYVVIGAGQTGLITAYQLSNLGKKVILIEQAELGGTYLLSQEVPKHFLSLMGREFSNSLKLFKDNRETFSALIKYRQKISKSILHKIESYKKSLFEKTLNNKNIEIIYGRAEFTSKSLVEVNSDTERHLVNFENAVISTGKNTLITPQLKGVEGVDFLHQHNIFLFERIPSHLGIIGVNSANLEIANIYANLGVKVSIFEEKDSNSALRPLDRSSFNYAIKQLLSKKVDFNFQTKITSVHKHVAGLILQSQSKKQFEVSHIYIHAQEAFADETLNVSKLGLNWTPAGIITNINGQTQQRNVWALGESSNQVNNSNKYSQIYDFVDRIKQNTTDSSKSLLSNTLLPLQLSGNHIEPIKSQTCKVDLDHPVITIGQTEAEATARYGRDVEVEIIDSGTIEGFTKLVLKAGSKQLIGVTLAGDFCSILEALTIKSFQSSISYITYRNYIKAFLGV